MNRAGKRNPGSWRDHGSGLEDAARPKLDKGDWPSNCHTLRLLERRNWKGAWTFCWRSSPAEWVERAGQVLGAAKGREG
jgi:hypothetical protein